MPDSFSNVKAVFEQRSMYDGVVEANYMHHAELVATLAEWAQRQPEPLRIIDLGCGDAWVATQAFHAANVASYSGVDVSEGSIEQARKNTAIWSGKADVVAGNLAEFLHNTPSDSATLVLASYSIHHFSTEGKIALIADCHRVLMRGGTFIWIDAVRNNDESRDQYINRLTRVMHNDWTELTLDERDRACTHVRESDFPETRQWMLDEVRRAGFERPATLLQSDFFDGWACMKN
jgi:ubiquinone/menaquinone biosynthesis C-methylase UbiE